jgi:predicted acetyltransferase
MNISILKKLVKIADHLDKKSLYKEADVVDSIIKKAIAVKQLTFKEPKSLNKYQSKQLETLLQEADAHPEFSGHHLVLGDEYDARRIVFLLDDDVVGFMTPREEDRFGEGRWRTGAIFVDKKFRGKGIAQEAIKDFFSKKKGYAWISNKNTSSQKAFYNAGFYKGEERNVGDSDLDQGHNWYKD